MGKILTDSEKTEKYNVNPARRRRIFERVMLVLAGTVLIGLGVTAMRITGWGVDPCSALALGLSEVSGLRYSLVLILMNCVLLAVQLTWMRGSFGFGTLVNAFCVGLTVDFFMMFVESAGIVEVALPVKLLLTTFGIAVVALGVACFLSAEMGLAPYDCIAPGIADRLSTGSSFGWIRSVQDGLFVCAVLAVALIGGVNVFDLIGINTILIVLFCGPCMQFFKQRLTDPWLVSRGRSSEKALEQ